MLEPAKKLFKAIETVFPFYLPMHSSRYRYNKPCFFIGGCGRSGTTLLRVMLGTHSKIYSGPELYYHVNILNAYKYYSSKFRLVKSLPARAYLLYRPNKLKRLENFYNISKKRILELRKSSLCFPEFMADLLELAAANAGKQIWLEKTPRNCQYFEYLNHYFPRMRFVHVIRDCRDVVCSLKEHPKYKIKDGKTVPTGINRPVGPCITRWINDVEAARQYKDRPNYIEIKYEDLLNSTRNTLEILFDYLGLPFDDSVLNHHKIASKKEKTENFVESKNSIEAINKSNTGKWGDGLTYVEAKEVQDRAGYLLKELGYIQDDSWLEYYTS